MYPQVGELLPPEEEWQMQPEVYDNNTYSLDVTFCGFKPDLHPGPHLWLAGRRVLWGTQVWTHTPPPPCHPNE